MTSAPPTSLDEYHEWAKHNLDPPFGDQAQTHYQMVLNSAKTSVDSSEFVAGLPDLLEGAGNDYATKRNGAQLLMHPMERPPEILKKPYESAIDKSFRQNFLWNDNGGPPDGEWIGPANWLTRFNDPLRTTIACKYLDGPGFLAERLAEHAKKLSLPFRMK